MISTNASKAVIELLMFQAGFGMVLMIGLFLGLWWALDRYHWERKRSQSAYWHFDEIDIECGRMHKQITLLTAQAAIYKKSKKQRAAKKGLDTVKRRAK